MSQRIDRVLVRLGIAVATAAVCTSIASGQVAAPGDVYYKVHIDQSYRYYAFLNDIAVWENRDHEGTELSFVAVHDTTDATGAVGTSATVLANAGDLTVDLDTYMHLAAQTGLYHVMTNTIRVDVYIRGSSNTRWWAQVVGNGEVSVSRFGGFPGTLQPVNGIISTAFMDTTVTLDSTGSLTRPVTTSRLLSGSTTTQLVVGSETYSRALTVNFRAPSTASQVVCVLGCMTAPANLNSLSTGRGELHVFPYVTPVGVQESIPHAAPLSVQVLPNPARRGTTVAFRAPAGTRARVGVFDLQGRCVAMLHDGAATGIHQNLAWDTTGVGTGLYFVKVEAAGRTVTTKLTRIE